MTQFFPSPAGGQAVEGVFVLDPATGQPTPTPAPLTDAQLRASVVPVAPNVTRGSGAVDASTQRVTLATDGPGVQALLSIDADIGAPADAAATSDTGSFSIIALLKRGMTNWTALLGRIPVLVGTLMPVEPLGAAGEPRQLPVGTASANTALTATCRRVTIRARKSDIRYLIGTGVQTANATTSHFLGMDERLDLAVPASAQIAVIRDIESTVNGVLELSELK